MARMLDSILVRVCRSYQCLFTSNHPGEQHLSYLHEAGRMDEFHEEYFKHEVGRGREVLERFERFSGDFRRWKVLDFGCGGGGTTCHLGTRFREAWGLDVEVDKLAFARREAVRAGQDNVHFVHYGGGRLPFEDASFDCLFSCDVMEHLPEPESYMVEFERVLVPGGLLLISFGPPWRHAHGKHMWSKLPGWWTHLLFPRPIVMATCGFPPETRWEELGIQRMTVGRFEKIINKHFDNICRYYRINRYLSSTQRVPFLREYFIAGVVGVWRKRGGATGDFS